MSTITNYHNRLVDISVFQGVKELGLATVNQSLFDNGGAVCTGIQKLIQRWLLTFLTPRGSLKFHKTFGTTFLKEAASFRTEINAEASFYTCNANACIQMREEETDDMPDDERIGTVDLITITVGAVGFELEVKLTSRAGTSAPVILPITVNPLQL